MQRVRFLARIVSPIRVGATSAKDCRAEEKVMRQGRTQSVIFFR